MSRYIDSEKLIAEVERYENTAIDAYNPLGEDADFWHGKVVACEDLKTLITSLQQEHPIKVYRVENENEQKGLWRKFDGTWEPLFDMLTDGQCKDMPMGDSPIYREGGKQWFASAPSRETLQKWFSKKDLEELTAKGFTISEFEVVGHKKVSDFEYIFTRDNIISRTYLKVSDIYPQEQPEVDLEKLGEIARHLIAVKDHEEDMRLSEDEWLLLNRIGYPERFNARKEEFVGVAESPLKTFPRVNDFECGGSYRH